MSVSGASLLELIVARTTFLFIDTLFGVGIRRQKLNLEGKPMEGNELVPSPLIASNYVCLLHFIPI